MSKDVAIWEVDDGDEAIEGLDEYGDPDPAYAAALGIVPAPLGRRAGAAGLDFALYCVLQVPYWVFALPLVLKLLTGRISWYGFVNHPGFILAIVMAGVTMVLTIAYCVVQLALLGRSGVTFGKGLMGLRGVNVKTLEKPGFWRSTLRALLVWGSGVTVVGPFFFLLSPLFDPQKRGCGWHDVIGQTWLVDVRQGLNPYDEKRMRIARKTVTAAPAPKAKALPSLATKEGEDKDGEYRPGARISSGVLGAARPYGSGGRPEVGLTGLEAPELPKVNPFDAKPGAPVVGGYLASKPQTDGPPTEEPKDPAAAMPAPAQVPDQPVPATPSGFVLTLDTGDRLDVTERLIVGRMPQSVEGARRVPINDDSLTMSKTHVAFRPVAEGVEVVDQGSVNGTAIVRHGTEYPLQPGDPAVAVPGDTIMIGSRAAVVAIEAVPGRGDT